MGFFSSFHKENDFKRMDDGPRWWQNKYTLLISLGVAVISFCCSLIIMCLGLGNQPIETKSNPSVFNHPMEFIYPYNVTDPSFKEGRPVSFDNDGNLHVGGGFSIYKRVYSDDSLQAKHLQVTALNEHVVVNAFDATLKVFLLNDDFSVRKYETFSLPHGRQPDQMKKLREDVLVIIGYGDLLPVYVHAFENDTIQVVFGEAGEWGLPRSIQPTFDILDDTCMAVSYYEPSLVIATAVGCLHQDEEHKENISIEITYNEDFYEDRTFHGIGGLSSHKYILAQVGLWNHKPGEKDVMEFIIATYKDNNVTLSKPYRFTNHGIYSFFDFSCINNSTCLMVYAEQDKSDGLSVTIIHYNEVSDSLEFGSSYPIQSGGGTGTSPSGLFQFIYLTFLSSTRFGVFYSNRLIGGGVAFVMGEITPSMDIKMIGPEYIISGAHKDENNEYYWCDISKIDDEKFILMESMTSNNEPKFEIHVGQVYSPPFGIITGFTNDNKVRITSEGTVTFPDTFPPFTIGKYYYVTTKGDYISGEFAGTAEIEGITKYIDTEEYILALENRLGLAVKEHTLFIQTNDIDL
ncbi:hypothetical protein WA158_007193 [Blastocystis sp. Blastoise]